MKNKWLFFVLLLIGIIVYYGLLVVPPKVKFGNLILFVIYVSAATFLIYRKTGDTDEKS